MTRPPTMVAVAAAALLALTVAATPSWATPAPPVLDDATVELLLAAVGELQRSTERLVTRVQALEARRAEANAARERLELENARLRRTVRTQAAPVGGWQSWPLDHEVADANRMLVAVADEVSTALGLGPVSGTPASAPRRAP